MPAAGHQRFESYSSSSCAPASSVARRSARPARRVAAARPRPRTRRGRAAPPQPLQRRHAARVERLAAVGRKRLRASSTRPPPGTPAAPDAALQRADGGVDLAGQSRARRRGWSITSSADVGAVAERRREHPRERLLEPPQRRVVVERVADARVPRQLGGDRRASSPRDGGRSSSPAAVAASADSADSPPEHVNTIARRPASGPIDVCAFSDLEHRRHVRRPRHAEPVEEHVVQLVRAGQRAGVRGGHAGARPRSRPT